MNVYFRLALFFYSLALIISVPFYLLIRVIKGKENLHRVAERLGITKKKLPEQYTHSLWIHAASLGETKVALTLIKYLPKKKDRFIVLTTQTLTAAAFASKNLPDNACHQFIPADHPLFIKRFIIHWKIHKAYGVESEIWPNTIMTLKKLDVPYKLVNARLSDKSFERWKKFKCLSYPLFQAIPLILSQSLKNTEYFRALNAQRVETIGNIKFLNQAPQYNEKQLQYWQKCTNGRPIWVAASTHEGEEKLLLSLQKKIKKTCPHVLLILVPRHPERFNDVYNLIKKSNLSVTRISAETFSKNTDVLLVDQMGTLGLFYKLAPVAFIGGSLVNVGGHNLLEAIQLNCLPVWGPYFQNCVETTESLGISNQGLSFHALQGKILAAIQNPTQSQKETADLQKMYKSAVENIETRLIKLL